MTTTEDQTPTAQRVTDAQLGDVIIYLEAGGPITSDGALDLALDLATERAAARHQADVRKALADTAKTLGAQVRKGTAR